jgi:hypothetical protein
MSQKSWLCLTNALHGRKGGDTPFQTQKYASRHQISPNYMVAVSDLGFLGVLATIDEMVYVG